MFVEQRYRTFWPRFWAGMVEGLVLMPFVVLDGWVFKHIRAPAILAAWFVFYSLSYAAYSVAMHAKYGQTLGKMLTRVRVLDVSEGAISLRQAFLRDSVWIGLTVVAVALDLPTVLKGLNPAKQEEITLGTWILLYGSGVWFLAELLTMLTNPKRRALHDLLAGTVVMRVARDQYLAPSPSRSA